MPDRRETMAGYVAREKIERDTYFLIPDYGTDKRRHNLEYIEEEDGSRLVKIPAHREVCPTCDGRGKHVNPSIDSNGITQSEMAELGEDFREGYFGGDYDITCSECRGNKVVLVEDDDLNDEQLEVLAYYQRALNEEAQEIYYRNRGYQF